MHSRNLSTYLFLIVLAAISTGYLLGLPAVPFHPDESTQLFTSGDVEIFLKRPADLFWRPEKENDLRQRYRELDAPLTHTILAIGRWFGGQPALPVDWDWGKTWRENDLAGALPSPGLLMAGRMAVAMLFPFSVLFLFLAARRVTNEFTAWVAALLLACNALILLHTRRAMAEGALLFTLTLSMWVMVTAEKRPWLVAIPAALAFCAKQTLAALGPAGLLAALWPLPGNSITSVKHKALHLFGQAALFGIVFAAIVLLLNPFLWSQPIPAAQAAFRARQALASAQVTDRPDQALNSPGRKFIGLIGSVYLIPPIMAETGNYLANTQAAEEAYLANPFHTLFRSLPAGGMLMVLSLFGFTVTAFRVARPGHPARRGLVLLLAATLFQTLALYALVPLPWQRYYLPAVPYACLWAAAGIDQLFLPLRGRKR
jgi:4-amino-4-deoxy-L-arabinose transferase-like glycosyltransferase